MKCVSQGGEGGAHHVKRKKEKWDSLGFPFGKKKGFWWALGPLFMTVGGRGHVRKGSFARGWFYWKPRGEKCREWGEGGSTRYRPMWEKVFLIPTSGKNEW